MAQGVWGQDVAASLCCSLFLAAFLCTVVGPPEAAVPLGEAPAPAWSTSSSSDHSAPAVVSHSCFVSSSSLSPVFFALP